MAESALETVPTTVFCPGFIPHKDTLPPEHTYARAKLIYNILRVMCFMSKSKCVDALAELKVLNSTLHERVSAYWKQLTPEQIQFFKGPRPKFFDDGTLAIWHPQKDNPVLQVVLNGEQPTDADKYGFKKSKLILPKHAGGIL